MGFSFLSFDLSFDDRRIVRKQCGRGKETTRAATLVSGIIENKSQISRTNYFERD